MALINDGATHNLIDVALITRRQILAEDFDGFNVVVENGYNMEYTHKIMGL
jgi:hypothetical protein